MSITKKDLRRIWSKFKNKEFGPQEYITYLYDNYKAQYITANWKDTEDIIKEFSKVLKSFGGTVIEDPSSEGSSDYGLIVIPNKELLTKTNNFNDLCVSYSFSLNTSYKNLVKVFGKPNRTISGDKKCSCQWLLKTLNNNLVLIYDYKVGIPYLGPEKGKKPEQITEWSVGSNKTSEASKLLDTVLTSKIGHKNFQITKY